MHFLNFNHESHSFRLTSKVEMFYILMEIKNPKKPQTNKPGKIICFKFFSFFQKENNQFLKVMTKVSSFLYLVTVCIQNFTELHSKEVGTLQIMFFAELVFHLKLKILVLTCDYLKNSCDFNMADKLSMPSCCFFFRWI